MRLTPPKAITFWIGVVLGVLGFLAFQGIFSFGVEAFWLVFIGWLLLVLGLLVRGL
jgi:hypothetical protein